MAISLPGHVGSLEQIHSREARGTRNAIQNQSRRHFLKAATLAGGGLAIGISLPTLSASADAAEASFNPSGFIHLHENGDVVLYCGRCEMGQGISTALPAAVADEMELDWSRVSVARGDS